MIRLLDILRHFQMYLFVEEEKIVRIWKTEEFAKYYLVI